MAFAHPHDPKTQWQAAETFGKLVAQGVIEHADALAAAFHAADAKAPRDLSRSDLRTRLAWHIHDCAEGWQRRRRHAEFLIRQDMRPLLERRLPAIEIVRAAHGVNERLGEPLLRREVVSIAAEEMQAALRFMRAPRSRRRVG